MKKFFTTIGICFAFTAGVFAQLKPEHPKFMFYLGLGESISSDKSKDNSYLSDAINFNAEAYKAIFLRHNLSMGLNAGFDYSQKTAPPFSALPIYHVSGESSNVVSTFPPEGPKQKSFRIALGPQINVHIGAFMLSPVLQFGYMNTSKSDYTIVQTLQVNGTTSRYTLVNLPTFKSSGFSFVPKFKVQYFLANWIGIWGEASYISGPQVQSSISLFSPSGDPKNGFYSQTQFTEGKTTMQSNATNYNAFGINGGVVFALGLSKKGYDHYKAHIENNYLSKKGYDSYKGHSDMGAFRMKLPDSIPAENVNLWLSKKGYDFYKARSDMSGIIIEGGHPGGDLISTRTNAAGAFELYNLEPGSYTFQIITPPLTVAERKAAKKARKAVRAKAIENPLYNPSGSSGQNPMSESKAAAKQAKKAKKATPSAVAGNPLYHQGSSAGVNPLSKEGLRPGEPIGGLVVKGSRNSSMSQLKMITDNNGTFEFVVEEKGDYSFQIDSAATAARLGGRTYTGGRKNEGAALKEGNPLYNGSGQSGTNPMSGIAGETGGEPAEGTLKGKITRPGDGGMKNSSDAASADAAPNPDKGTLNRLSMTPTSTRQQSDTQTANHRKDVRTYTGGRKNDGNAVALSTGNPIGGIIVKGGKNPGRSMITVTTSSNGEIELLDMKPGEYKFYLTQPSSGTSSARKEKRTYTGGRKIESAVDPVRTGLNTVNGTPNRISMNVTVGKMTNPEPGSPIGGIVVKGGKNPGGNLFTVQTNSKGEFTFSIKEAGDYIFTFIEPTKPQGKGITEKGISSTKGRPKSQSKSISEKGVSSTKGRPKSK